MYRILIADDEPIERMVISKKINNVFPGQFEIFQAENGREAVSVYEEKRCDIALLDIEMPGINGIEAAEQIREKNNRCCIVFITAFDEFLYAKGAIRVKALDYLLKPCNDEELANALYEAVRILDSKQEVIEEKTEHTYNENANIKSVLIAEEIRNYIEKHYKDELGIQDVAGVLNYSEAYFCKIFRQCFDKSFTTYLMEYRLKKAKELMMDLRYSIKDIGAEVGYRDSNYFSKIFKKAEGMTPTEFRQRVLAQKINQ